MWTNSFVAWAEQKRRMDKMQEMSDVPRNWLPNFGRVFNPGPRSATAQEFRSEVERLLDPTHFLKVSGCEGEPEEKGGNCALISKVISIML